MKYIPLVALLATTLASGQDFEKLRVDVRPSAPSDGVMGPPIIIDRTGAPLAVKLDGSLTPVGPQSTETQTAEKIDVRLKYAQGGPVDVESSVSWEKLDQDLRMKGFGQPDVIIDFGSRKQIDQVASDLRSAVSGVAEVMRRRPPSSTEFEALRDAVRPAGLERLVDEAASNPFSELRDLHQLWERVVDALLDRALEKYEDAASKGRLTRQRYYQIKALLSERAAAAQDDPLSSETYRRLAGFMAQVEAASQTLTQAEADDARAQFKLELVRDRMQRVMDYVLTAAERGFVPAGWHERLGNYLTHRARLGN